MKILSKEKFVWSEDPEIIKTALLHQSILRDIRKSAMSLDLSRHVEYSDLIKFVELIREKTK